MKDKIERIIYDLESCVGMFDYLLPPEENCLLVTYIRELQQENQQLKEEKEKLDRDRKWYLEKIKENQKKLHTSNGNEFTKYELLDDYERILQENQQLKERINMTKNINRKNKELKERVEQLELILDKIRENLLYSKEYKVANAMKLNAEQSILINLLQILDKVIE